MGWFEGGDLSSHPEKKMHHPCQNRFLCCSQWGASRQPTGDTVTKQLLWSEETNVGIVAECQPNLFLPLSTAPASTFRAGSSLAGARGSLVSSERGTGASRRAMEKLPRTLEQA